DQTAKPGNRTESAPAAKGETSALLNMDEVRIDPAWALRIPATLALRRKVLPFAELDGHVYVACVDVKDSAALRAIERQLSQAVRPEQAEAESLRRALKRIYGDGSSPT